MSADSGTIDLEGIKFFLDGVEMDGLVLDQPFEIADTDAMLGGFLADGSPFEFRLSSTLSDSIRPAVTLRVTRVPNLNTCPTDLSGDGTTNFPDLLLVLASFGSDANGDTNLDFVTDLADLLAVLADFGQACP